MLCRMHDMKDYLLRNEQKQKVRLEMCYDFILLLKIYHTTLSNALTVRKEIIDKLERFEDEHSNN